MKKPQVFLKAMPVIMNRGGLKPGQERQAWEWREHALRIGRDPLGLFVWLMVHPDRRNAMVTSEDEREAGLAMNRARRERERLRRERYERHLQSDLWRWIRKCKLKQAKYTCERCEKRCVRTDLEVHHKTYERLGRERLEDLECLCYTCHAKHHGYAEIGNMGALIDGFWRWVEDKP